MSQQMCLIVYLFSMWSVYYTFSYSRLVKPGFGSSFFFFLQYGTGVEFCFRACLLLFLARLNLITRAYNNNKLTKNRRFDIHRSLLVKNFPVNQLLYLEHLPLHVSSAIAKRLPSQLCMGSLERIQKGALQA